MSGFALPLNAYRPDPNDPIRAAQAGVNLSGMLQQQRIQQQMAPGQMQLQQQAIQQGQQEQQLRQIQLQDAQAGMKAMQAWDGKDPNALPDLIRQNGGSLNAVMSARNGVIEQQTKIAGMTKAQQDIAKQQNDYLLGKLQAATDPSVTDDQLPASVVKAAQDSINDGYLDPQHAQGIQQILQQYAGDPKGLRDHLALYEKGLQSQSEQFAQAQKERATATQEKEAQTKATEAQTASEKFQAELPGGVLEDPTKKYLRLSAAEDNGQKLQPEDAAFVKAFGSKMDRETRLRNNLQFVNPWIPGGGGAPNAPGLPTASAGPTAPAGGAPAQSAPVTPATNTTPAQIGTAGIERVPQEIRPQVQAILDYRAADVPVGRTNKQNQAVNYWVNALDPQHDTANYPAKQKILQQYTKDMASGSLGAINTALGHLNELQVAAKAVEQNNIPLLNSIANKFGVATGSDAPTTYTAILHRVGPEMTSAYVKGGGGEAERGANEQDFDISKGAKQIESNINESAMLLNSKLAAQRKDWNDTFRPYRDSDQFDNRFLTPDAKSILNTASAKAPTAKAAAAAVPSAGNAKYHYGGGKGEIFSNDGKTWYDSTGKQVTGK